MPPRTSARNKAAAAAAAAKLEEKKAAEKPATKARGKNAAVAKVKAEPVSPVRNGKKKKPAGAAPSKKRKAAVESDAEEEHECDSHDEADDQEDEAVKEEEEDKKKPAPKKRKTAKAKDEDMAPLAQRTAVSSLKKAMFIGAHVSAAGGVQNSITNATQIGANAFALFLKSQRKWTSPALEPSARDAFRAAAGDAPYAAGKHVLPHGSYLVNLAQADKAKADQAFDNFVDDLRRCESLGISLYNFHPGSTGGAPMAEATARIASQLNRAHAAVPGTVVTVLENMCGAGNVVGGRLEDLRAIIDGVEDKSRVGVCIDTCHAFAAGYDLRTPEAFAATMADFDRVVGLRYLRALHLNDSKAPFASHRDLHANIGTGFLGLRAFHSVVNYDGFQDLPMVLETPIDRKGADGKTVEDKKIWADEIKLLEWLIGADPDSDEFKEKEKALSAQGEAERKRIQQQVDAKSAKDAKKSAGAKKGAKKGKKAASEDTDEE